MPVIKSILKPLAEELQLCLLLTHLGVLLCGIVRWCLNPPGLQQPQWAAMTKCRHACSSQAHGMASAYGSTTTPPWMGSISSDLRIWSMAPCTPTNLDPLALWVRYYCGNSAGHRRKGVESKPRRNRRLSVHKDDSEEMSLPCFQRLGRAQVSKGFRCLISNKH